MNENENYIIPERIEMFLNSIMNIIVCRLMNGTVWELQCIAVLFSIIQVRRHVDRRVLIVILMWIHMTCDQEDTR